jgi:hypothetical protein
LTDHHWHDLGYQVLVTELLRQHERILRIDEPRVENDMANQFISLLGSPHFDFGTFQQVRVVFVVNLVILPRHRRFERDVLRDVQIF